MNVALVHMNSSTHPLIHSIHSILSTVVIQQMQQQQLFSPQLHIASANGYLSVVEFLLDHHVSTDVVDDDLWQPVHAAACWGHVSYIYLLMTCPEQLSSLSLSLFLFPFQLRNQSIIRFCSPPSLAALTLASTSAGCTGSTRSSWSRPAGAHQKW